MLTVLPAANQRNLLQPEACQAAAMALRNCILLLVLTVIATVAASPIPEPGYYGGDYHEHHIIHAPFHVHTVHHYHVKKVHVPVYVKEVYHGWHPWD